MKCLGPCGVPVTKHLALGMYKKHKFGWMRKVFVANPEDPSSVPRTHIGEGENQVLKAVFCLMVLEGEKSGTSGLSLVGAGDYRAEGPSGEAEGPGCQREGVTP